MRSARLPQPAKPEAPHDAPAGRALAALAPAAGAGAFGLWAGTVEGGATAAGATAGHALLLAAALAGAAASWRDPLALGRAGRLLPWALWLLTAASAWASPVPRAGIVAVALLPAFLLVPAAVAHAWRGSPGRRWGLPGIAAVVAVSALWALAGRLLGGDERASAPVGHHLLLAVWLLALLPLAALPAATGRGWRRWLGGGAAVAGVAALVATGSLTAWGGLAFEGVLAAWAVVRRAGGTSSCREVDRRRRRRGAFAAATAVALLALLVAFAAPRLLRIVTGDDPSASAREVYARAALAGAAERPALGWGPGSAAWTAAEHLRPVPGINPPGEVVAEHHALPLQLAYELGWTGLLLALATAAVFAARRLRSLAGLRAVPGGPFAGGAAAGGGSGPAASGVAAAGGLPGVTGTSPGGGSPGASDPALAAAGLIGLAGAAVALLATGWLAVAALPVALAVAAGAALAGSLRRAPAVSAAPAVAAEAGQGTRRLRRTAPVLLYVLAAAVVLAPLDLARLAYDRAVVAESPEAARTALDRAVRLDPRFPLYRAWRAWAGEGVEPPAAVAAGARRAAEDALGLGALWLAAGVYGADAGAPWAPAALDRACELDPLGALAPFHRMAIAPGSPAAPEAGARALLAAPALAAATFWEDRPELLEAALAEALAWEGIDPGWREALAAQAGALGPPAGETAQLALRIDPGFTESLLLRAFRRRSRPFLLAPVTVRREAAERIALPPATELPTSRAAAFAGPRCGAPFHSPRRPVGR